MTRVAGALISALMWTVIAADALAATTSIWTARHGFQSAERCALELKPAPLSGREERVHQMPTAPATSLRIGASGVALASTFWIPARPDGKVALLHCPDQRTYQVFDVFVAGQAEPAAHVGIEPARQSRVFATARVLTPAQAEQAALSLKRSEEADGLAAGAEDGNGTVLVMAAGRARNFVICSSASGLQVRDGNLQNVLFSARRLESVHLLEDGTRSRRINGTSYDFAHVMFPSRGRAQGWVALAYLKTAEQCGATARTTPAPAPPSRRAEPTRASARPTTSPARAGGSLDLLAPNCAKTTMLAAAKITARTIWGNAPVSSGRCALGVRQALQKSKVGGVRGGLGNAIDFLRTLKAHGFVDTGIRDVTKAPTGAVLVFNGPFTSTYLRTGRMSRPYGHYVGHVAIKGGDGWYYTDGRTREPAIGWRNNRNVSRIRNLVGVMMPGERLVRQYSGRCGNL